MYPGQQNNGLFRPGQTLFKESEFGHTRFFQTDISQFAENDIVLPISHFVDLGQYRWSFENTDKLFWFYSLDQAFLTSVKDIFHGEHDVL